MKMHQIRIISSVLHSPNHTMQTASKHMARTQAEHLTMQQQIHLLWRQNFCVCGRKKRGKGKGRGEREKEEKGKEERKEERTHEHWNISLWMNPKCGVFSFAKTRPEKINLAIHDQLKIDDVFGVTQPLEVVTDRQAKRFPRRICTTTYVWEKVSRGRSACQQDTNQVPWDCTRFLHTFSTSV